MRGLQLAARFAALPIAVFSAVLCWLWLQATVFAVETPPGPPNVDHGGVLGTTSVHAAPLGGYTCVAGEWQFYISQIPTNPPPTIMVEWANGVQQAVPRSGFEQSVAYYSTSDPATLGTTVVDAEAVVDTSWNGSFSILHGPCEDGVVRVAQNVPLVPVAAAYPAIALGAAAVAHAVRRRRHPRSVLTAHPA
ncbi:MAG TPA: hypothetical protein VFX49_22800 [Chloroflexota bacterium]|nr:hypothetical protein [Chloroflexota bacterium]